MSFTKIDNHVLDALIQSGLNSTEMAVVLHVLRKTVGWNKTEDTISISQFMEATGKSRQSVVDAVKKTRLVKIIRLVKETRLGSVYSFNQSVDTWGLVKKTRLVKDPSIASQGSRDLLVKDTRHTKETFTKDNIQKKVMRFFKRESSEYALAMYMKDRVESHIGGKIPGFNIQAWSSELSKLTKHYESKVIHAVIDFSLQHEFWGSKVLDPRGLTKHFTKLLAAAREEYGENKHSEVASI